MRRLLIGLTALSLVVGLGACGDDDDDDVATDDSSEEATDEGAEEQGEVDDAKAAFCTEFNDADGGDTPVEEVQASADRAIAAQTATDTQEQSDALQLLADLAAAAIAADDGDGIITDAETQAAVAEFPTAEDAIGELTSWCA